ncbi:MAG: acyl carrier protein [Chitinophagales bacterium]|nr:acyl carrier protein [Chitinophagales bacterium]
MDEFIAMLYDELGPLPTGALSPETQFRQLEAWSSMTALLIIARIDADYQVAITAAELASAHTVSDLYQLVKKPN